MPKSKTNSREVVLRLLHEQEVVSGGAIARELGLTRSAIWKVICKLRHDGYVIDASRGRGYRLRAEPDTVNEAGIRSFMGNSGDDKDDSAEEGEDDSADHLRDLPRGTARSERVIGRRIICLEETDSTNSYCKRLAREHKEQVAAQRGHRKRIAESLDGTVVTAECQKLGRGRMNRSFSSPSRKGIYMSVILCPDMPPEALFPLTSIAGVCVCAAVQRVTNVRPQIKWPNDVILNGKKICGVLTELSMEGESGNVDFVIVGIGINVSQTPDDFTADVAQIASSLNYELKIEVLRSQLIAAVIDELESAYGELKNGSLQRCLAAYRRDCINIGKRVRIISRRSDIADYEAYAIGVDPDFGLIVRRDDGREEIIRSGEVSVHGIYGYV